MIHDTSELDRASLHTRLEPLCARRRRGELQLIIANIIDPKPERSRAQIFTPEWDPTQRAALSAGINPSALIWAPRACARLILSERT